MRKARWRKLIKVAANIGNSLVLQWKKLVRVLSCRLVSMFAESMFIYFSFGYCLFQLCLCLFRRQLNVMNFTHCTCKVFINIIVSWVPAIDFTIFKQITPARIASFCRHISLISGSRLYEMQRHISFVSGKSILTTSLGSKSHFWQAGKLYIYILCIIAIFQYLSIYIPNTLASKLQQE